MNKTEILQNELKELKLFIGYDEINAVMTQAEKENIGFLEYTLRLLKKEFAIRNSRRIGKNLKISHLPQNCDLNKYDYSSCNGLTKTQINQLREMRWLEDKYNLIILGPPGTGKTYVASGLGFDAIKTGYRVLFRTMDEIISTMKLKEATISAEREYKRLSEAELVIIDDMMSFPLDKSDAVNLFHLVNKLHEKSSLIITTNKEPGEWNQSLNDEAVAAAILDRLMYKCQPITLRGKSYRLENRKTIFSKSQSKQNEKFNSISQK